jgi:hypothetical protein
MPPEKNSGVSKAQLAVVALFAATITGIAPLVYGQKAKTEAVKTEPVATTSSAHKTAAEAAEIERCTVPSFAKMLGHEEKWKQHNNCK